ncbi:MAG TPA: hypothetical protein VFQ85_00030 [Mycobacteriales bacterium]|nr:hypothetical protein [Mycobacteriales bacterium]
MADWDGLRRGLEDSVTPPPLSALRARKQRREHRRVVAVTAAFAMVGIAGGVAALGRDAQRARRPDVAAVGTTSDRVALGSRFVPDDQADYVVTDVDFVDPSTGWAIGLKCTGATCDVATWRTTDGGGSWEARVPVATGVARTSFVQEDPRGGAARSLRMVDANEGFAYNPDLYVTHDGARTWHRVPQPSKVASVSVLDRSVWVTEHGCGAEDDCPVVVRSGTVGRALALRDLPVPRTLGSSLVRRGDTAHGYLLAWGGEGAGLHATADGGRTWDSRPGPCGEPHAAALSGGHGPVLWLVCSDEPMPDGKRVTAAKRAFLSTDAGVTWRQTGTLPDAGELTDLVGVSSRVAYATTQLPARLLLTTDGGATWHPANGTARAGYGYGNVSTVDARHAWAMGDAGVLWRTRDGVTWERLALPPGAPRAVATPSASPTPSLPPGTAPPGDAAVRWTGLSFYDASHGYAIGRRCTGHLCRTVLRRTADGGRNWTVAPAPTHEWEDDAGHTPWQVSRVEFANARDGWLYDENLYTTHDGGAHWTDTGLTAVREVAAAGGEVWQVGYNGCAGMDCSGFLRHEPVHGGTPTDGGFEEDELGHVSLAPVDARTAFLVHDGHLLHADEPTGRATTDGGRTWRAFAAPCPSAAFRQASATSATDVWVTCTGGDGRGAVARSRDGGRHWTTARHEQAIDVLRAVSPGLAFATDPAGVEVTRDGGETWRSMPGVPAGGEVAAFGIVDGRTGYLLLADGTVYVMTDGASWERATRP